MFRHKFREIERSKLEEKLKVMIDLYFKNQTCYVEMSCILKEHIDSNMQRYEKLFGRPFNDRTTYMRSDHD